MKTQNESKSNIFGRRLKAARLIANIPQDQLGVRIGLDERTASARISRYESGTHEPAAHTATLLAAALNVPLAYLYCDDERLAPMLLQIWCLSDVHWARLERFIKYELHSPNSEST